MLGSAASVATEGLALLGGVVDPLSIATQGFIVSVQAAVVSPDVPIESQPGARGSAGFSAPGMPAAWAARAAPALPLAAVARRFAAALGAALSDDPAAAALAATLALHAETEDDEGVS